MFRQFQMEGFVNMYVQQPSNDEKAIVFVSEDIETSPPVIGHARPTDPESGRFTERLKIAEPGKISSRI